MELHNVMNVSMSICLQLSSVALRVILWDAKKSKNMTFRGEVRNSSETVITVLCILKSNHLHVK